MPTAVRHSANTLALTPLKHTDAGHSSLQREGQPCTSCTPDAGLHAVLKHCLELGTQGSQAGTGQLAGYAPQHTRGSQLSVTCSTHLRHPLAHAQQLRFNSTLVCSVAWHTRVVAASSVTQMSLTSTLSCGIALPVHHSQLTAAACLAVQHGSPEWRRPPL